jgi:hypothetical protein
MSEPCIKEEKIGALTHSVERIEKELFNGDQGLCKSVPVLANNVKHLTNSVEALRTTISGLDIFKNEIKGAEKREDEIKKTRLTYFQILGIVMAAIVGIFAVITSVRGIVNDARFNKQWKAEVKQGPSDSSITRSLKALPLDSTKLFEK